MCVQRSQGNLWEPIFSSHMGSRNGTQVARLGGKCLYPLCHLTSPFSLMCWGSLSISLEKKEGSVGFLMPLILVLVTQTLGQGNVMRI